MASYFSLHERNPAGWRCVGTACTFEGGGGSGEPIYCRGRCYAPHGAGGWEVPRLNLAARPVVLRHLLGDDRSADDYALPDGDTVLDAVQRSGLRGRGGAAYPTAAKWRAARDTPADQRYVVANGDEGDPGSFVDRLLLEDTPHAVLAGMVACARAIGATVGYVLVRGEYPRAVDRLRHALDQATRLGWLGDLEVHVVVGRGSYVCGEETALIRAIEGCRAEPRAKPPFPAQSGLWGKPTVVQNIETLSIVPWIVQNRAPAAQKGVCVSGAVARPGLVEIELGTPLRRVLDEGAGGPAQGRRWKMALVGGPMGRVLPERLFDTPLDLDGLPGMGHAGVVVIDDTVSARTLAEHLFGFARDESCGNCTPCREGTAVLAQAGDRVALERLLDVLETGSLCGFGKSVPKPVRDLLQHFPEEMFP